MRVPHRCLVFGSEGFWTERCFWNFRICDDVFFAQAELVGLMELIYLLQDHPRHTFSLGRLSLNMLCL